MALGRGVARVAAEGALSAMMMLSRDGPWPPAKT